MLSGMRTSFGNLVLRVAAWLMASLGLLAWIRVGWKASSSVDEVTPQGQEGSELMAWALTGTMLMIFGMVLLHFAADGSEQGESEQTPSA